jgi:putative ABC transport system permease protein
MIQKWRLAFKFARRELRSGFSGFRIFLASLTLGVMAISGVGSLGQAFLTGLAEQGSQLLGGDVEASRLYRPADANEAAFFARWGRVSETATMRAIARDDDTDSAAGARTLIELKAVDSAYPLIGQMQLSPAMPLRDAIACNAETCGVAVEDTLLTRLNRKVGDTILIGDARVQIRAAIVSEPDRVAGGFELGPHVLTSLETLSRAHIATEGSLITYAYRVAFANPTAQPVAFRGALEDAFADGGWRVEDRDNAVPQIRRFVRQTTMFLTLVGLTALIVGGVGAGQAVSAFIERRRASIGTMKAIGADGDEIFLIYLLQVMAVAMLGIVIGLALGAALPFAVQHFFGADIPAPAHYAVYTGPLALGAAFGFLAALGFAILPLARAREIAPAGLFRDLVAPTRLRGRLPYRITAYLCFAVIAALSVGLSPYPRFNLYFLAGAAGVLIVLRLVGALLLALLARIHPRAQTLRLAFGNLLRPGSPSADIMVALGLGLTLLATVTLTEASVNAQVQNELPSRAPSFFFVDIQPDEIGPFTQLVSHWPSAQDFEAVPMMRGRITKVKGVPSSEVKTQGNGRGLLNGDRGVTYAAAKPKDAHVTKGLWWPPSYNGPTLVSIDSTFAQNLGLQLGDTITVNVLGRDIDATIQNFREVDFRTGRINFFMIFSPGTVDKAPHSFLASVRLAPNQEEALFAAQAKAFPNVTAIRVKDALAQLASLLQALTRGIMAASLVTILAGILVLAGAIAAGHRARLYDAVVLKVLGATRAKLAGVYAVEYGLLGALAGLAAFAAGLIAAWGITYAIFDIPLVFAGRALLLTIVGGALGTLILGLAGGFAALSAKPAARLRNP